MKWMMNAIFRVENIKTHGRLHYMLKKKKMASESDYRVTIPTMHQTLSVKESKPIRRTTGKAGLMYTLDYNGLCTGEYDGAFQKPVWEQFKESNMVS